MTSMAEETISAPNLNTFLRPRFGEQKEWDVSGGGVCAKPFAQGPAFAQNDWGINDGITIEQNKDSFLNSK